MTPDQRLYPPTRPDPVAFGCPDRGEVVCANNPRQGPTTAGPSTDVSTSTLTTYVTNDNSTNHDLEANLLVIPRVIPPGS